MWIFLSLALVAACIISATGTPLPSSSHGSRRSAGSDNSDSFAWPASEDHLFDDEAFPLRASARGDLNSEPSAEAQRFAGYRGHHKGHRRLSSPSPSELHPSDQTPYNDPFSGFFFDMQDMMKILRDQMSVVLSRAPPRNGHEDPVSLNPSDVRNQSTTKVDIQQLKYLPRLSESRWQNEIDNRIDSYQPYYHYQRPFNTNRPKETSRPIHNHQPKLNEAINRPRHFESRPSYNTNHLNYKSYQPSYDSFDSINNNQFVDLSGDTKVNDFMATQQQAGIIMTDPDAEIIDIHKKPVPKFQYPQYNYHY